MQILILTLLVAAVTGTTQFPSDISFQNTPQILQGILLQLVPQVPLTQVENKQALPTGAQIILLHPFQQHQLPFIQDAPNGQIIYLQNTPQQILSQPQPIGSFTSDRGSNLYPQPNLYRTSEPSYESQTQTTIYKKQSSLPNISKYQGLIKSGSVTSKPKLSNQGTYNLGSTTQTLSNSLKGSNDADSPNQNYQRTYNSGSTSQSGQGGVNGYVILKQNQDDNFDGNFQYNYETDHGIAVDVVGSVKNPGTKDQIQVIQGSYSYMNPDGTVITTTYTADENGFVAHGNHLPTVGPLPEAISKSLAYIASQPSTEEKK